jgi:hypothetical protein
VLSSRPVPEAPVRVQTALPPGGPGELPFRLIGETVQVQRRGEQLQVFHRGELVANHPVLSGKYQMRILPEHGPGAIARNARLRYSTAPGSPPGSSESTEVQVRDLALYDQLAGVSALEVTP